MVQKSEFAKGLMMLAEVFKRECDDLLTEGYFLVLRELSFEEWRKAVVMALRSCRFMPTPSELWELARPPKVRNPDSALKEIRQAFLRYGRNRTPQWSDPAIEESVESVGGWNHLCSLTEEQFQRFTVPQIAKVYMSASGGEVAPRVRH